MTWEAQMTESLKGFLLKKKKKKCDYESANIKGNDAQRLIKSMGRTIANREIISLSNNKK